MWDGRRYRYWHLVVLIVCVCSCSWSFVLGSWFVLWLWIGSANVIVSFLGVTLFFFICSCASVVCFFDINTLLCSCLLCSSLLYSRSPPRHLQLALHFLQGQGQWRTRGAHRGLRVPSRMRLKPVGRRWIILPAESRCGSRGMGSALTLFKFDLTS